MVQISIVYWSGTGNTEQWLTKSKQQQRVPVLKFEKMLFDDTTVDAVAGKDVFSSVAPQWAAKNWKKR